MDGTVFQIAVFLGATFVAALVAGVTGLCLRADRRRGLAACPDAAQTATLTSRLRPDRAGLRHLENAACLQLEPDRGRISSAARRAVAIGVLVLHWANPAYLRIGDRRRSSCCIRSTASPVPTLKPERGGIGGRHRRRLYRAACSARPTGFAGILIVHLVRPARLAADMQRGVFQPVSCRDCMAMSRAGAWRHRFDSSATPCRLLLLGLPALAAGTWAGFALYGRLGRCGLSQGRAGSAARFRLCHCILSLVDE